MKMLLLDAFRRLGLERPCISVLAFLKPPCCEEAQTTFQGEERPSTGGMKMLVTTARHLRKAVSDPHSQSSRQTVETINVGEGVE